MSATATTRRLPPLEMLTTQRGSDGLWHARYPGGLRTLCGQLTFKRGRGRPGSPTCERCVSAAKAFDRIDRSAPESWRPLLRRSRP